MDIIRIFAVYLAILASQSGIYAGSIGSNMPVITPRPTATASPVPTATPRSYEIIKQGMRGDNVKRMQEALIRLGYLTGTADGAYGPKTRAAVEDFQAANNLSVTGAGNNATLQLLFDGTPLRKGQTATPVPATPVPTATPVPAPAELAVIYRDQFGNILYESTVTLTGTTLITADSSLVPEGFILESEKTVQVLYANGKLYPARVIFEWESNNIPEKMQIPVYYIVETDGTQSILYETTLEIAVGSSAMITADLSLVPGYTLLSAPTAFAVTDKKGNLVPDHIEFIVTKSEPND